MDSDAFLRGSDIEHLEKLLEGLVNVAPLQVFLELAILDLEEVQEVIHQEEHELGGVPDDSEEPLPVPLYHIVVQMIQQPNHRVERRPHVMRHSGSENFVEGVLDFELFVLNERSQILDHDHGVLEVLEQDVTFIERDDVRANII